MLHCKISFTEKEILYELDLAFAGTAGAYFPVGELKDIKYNFFLELEHGHCIAAGNRIHLYSDTRRWAVVFEQNGYNIKASVGCVQLIYVGNCIRYPVEKYPERDYITNSTMIELISADELERICNKEGTEVEQFELISPLAADVLVRDKRVSIEHDPQQYETVGIQFRDYDNLRKLPGFGDLIRYLHETDPDVISATEADIRKHIPADLKKIMTIDEFHYMSHYQKAVLPSGQETFQLIAKVLVTGDAAEWKPTLKANNHWSNWASGHL